MLSYPNKDVQESKMAKTAVARERNTDLDATKLYLKDVSKNPLLTHAQEISLSQQIGTSRKAIVYNLFQIPSAITQFEKAVQEMRAGTRSMHLAFNLEDENSDMTQALPQLVSTIGELQQNPTDAALRDNVSEVISELPIKMAFWDELAQPFADLVKNITQVQGSYLRFAQSCGITRETFLECYENQNTKPNAKWLAFTNKHALQISKFTQDLDAIAAQTGLGIQELQTLISNIRVAQKSKDEAVGTMLRSNLRLVVSVAKKYINVSPTPLLDLIQEGNIGLLKAIEKYNWRLGFRFSTYATWWIKQCVLKAVNEQHRTIRIPSHMTDLAKKVLQAKEQYVSQVGFEPSVQEIADMIEHDVEQVARVYTVAQGTISLETPVGDSEDQNLGALIEDVDGVNAFERVAAVDTRNAVAQVLQDLTPKEERVIRMRFGIGVDEESTLEDVGNVLGVTRERIRQIEHKALEKLREPLMAQKMASAFE